MSCYSSVQALMRVMSICPVRRLEMSCSHTHISSPQPCLELGKYTLEVSDTVVFFLDHP